MFNAFHLTLFLYSGIWLLLTLRNVTQCLRIQCPTTIFRYYGGEYTVNLCMFS